MFIPLRSGFSLSECASLTVVGTSTDAFMKIRIFRTSVLAGSLVLLVACSSVVPKAERETINPAELVSLDLVNVINQVHNLHPSSTSLLMPVESTRNDEFAQMLMRALQQAGYAIRTQGAVSQSKPVSYLVSQRIDENQASIVTYTVHVGEVSLRRSYRQESDGWISPVAAMQIKGADASQLSINDEIFNRSTGAWSDSVDTSVPSDLPAPDPVLPGLQPARPPVSEPDPSPKTVETMASQSPSTLDNAEPSSVQPSESLMISSGPDRIEQVASTKWPESITPLSRRTPLKKVRPLLDIAAPGLAGTNDAQLYSQYSKLQLFSTDNVRELGQSNFAEMLQEMGTVKETILTFNNDSTRLGVNNKERVKHFVAQFDPDRDVFSVIGCSHGNTAVQGGQQALALGRALRVKQELQFAGIPDNRILEEGCWASERFDERMPRRGVVLSLKRRG